METVMRVYDERYGGVRTRLEAEKGADATELAAEEILNVVFNGKEGAHREGAANVPVENVADEPEAAPIEEPAEEAPEGLMHTNEGWDSEDWAQKQKAPLAVEFAEVMPKRKDLKLLNDAIEAVERLSDSGWEMSAKVRRDAVAMVEGWKNERLLHFKALIDWRALEGDGGDTD